MPKMLNTKDAALLAKNDPRNLTANEMRAYFKIIKNTVISNRIFLCPEDEFVVFCDKNNIEINQ